MTGLMITCTVGLIFLRGVMTGADAYAVFIDGARRGMKAAVCLLPALCAMLLLMKALVASGVMESVTRLLSPLTARMSIPEEVTPMLLLRPLTGSGSMAALQEIFASCGVDSRAGRLASAVMCSSETVFYTLTVYAGAAGVKRLPGVITASLTGYAASVAVCAWLIR